MEIRLRTTGVACHMGSHSITCHLTHANTPGLKPSQWRLVLDLPTLEGWKAELTYGWLHTQMVYLPTDGHPSKY